VIEEVVIVAAVEVEVEVKAEIVLSHVHQSVTDAHLPSLMNFLSLKSKLVHSFEYSLIHPHNTISFSL
jgi:hypothetical protein